VSADSPDSGQFEDPLSNFEPTEYGSELERVLAEEPVLAMRSQPYAEVKPTTSVRQAVRVLQGLEIASLLVVDEGKLVGIFTERDVLEKVAERYEKIADDPVGDVMTSNPLVVYGGDPSGAALAAIAAAGYRHVPVVNESDEVLGIVSPRRAFTFIEDHFDSEMT